MISITGVHIDTTSSTLSARNTTSVIWHAIQALVECLITSTSIHSSQIRMSHYSHCIVFLSRTLLKSRSGVRRSDSIVDYLVRNVIQTGCLATIWAIAALVTWFWLSRNVTIYRIFDITSGTIYTHVGGSFLSPTVCLIRRMGLVGHI